MRPTTAATGRSRASTADDSTPAPHMAVPVLTPSIPRAWNPATTMTSEAADPAGMARPSELPTSVLRCT